MSLEQVFWDLLHAERKLGAFSDDLFMLEGVDTQRYNTLYVSALHRVMNAIEVVSLLLGKEKSASIRADFVKWAEQAQAS